MSGIFTFILKAQKMQYNVKNQLSVLKMSIVFQEKCPKMKMNA